MPRGIFRDGIYAHVVYEGGVSVPISKALYKMRGYQPPFEALPDKEEYEQAQRP